MAVVDDPTAKQRTVQGKAGAYAGTKKYGDAANLPVSAMKKRGASSRRGRADWRRQRRRTDPSPLAVEGGGHPSGSASKVHKPHLDEMHGPESLPYRPNRASHPSRPSAAAAKSSSQPTRANPAPSSAPHRDQAAARRDIGVDGRRGNPARHLAPLPRREMLRRQIDLPNSLSKSNNPGLIRHMLRTSCNRF